MPIEAKQPNNTFDITITSLERALIVAALDHILPMSAYKDQKETNELLRYKLLRLSPNKP